MIMYFETQTVGIIQSKGKNINNRPKVFTPTPTKDKCLALWNNIINDGSNNFGICITRYVSNPGLILRKHNKISKFCSFGRIEMDSCDM